MSSTQEASSQCTSKSKKQDPKISRRSWTQAEELGLIMALKELAKDPKFKADNGFKAGYLRELEDLLHVNCPGTDLKGMPHINSKLSTWRKFYHSLSGMLRRSGVGFSPRGNFMIECEDEQWEQIVKVDPNARLMRHKPWPYYDDWIEIFGKDRATGENAEDIYEAYIRMTKQVDLNPELELDGEDANFSVDNNNIGDDASNDQVSQSTKLEVPAKKRSRSKKKARFEEGLQGVCEMLAEQNDATNARLDHIASRIGYEYDVTKARGETFEQLGEIPGLSVSTRFIVCELITFKVERLDIWRGLKKEARADYVEHLLQTTRT